MPDVPTAEEDVRVQPPPKSSQRPAQRQQPQPLPPPVLRDVGPAAHEDRSTEDVLKALASEKSVSENEASSALEWFLSEDPEEDEQQTHTIELNVGVGDREHWISWIVRPIDTDELRRIQRSTAALRRRNRQDDLAVDQLGNLRIIITGSVEPNIEQIAREQNVKPEALLTRRFQRKPGLVAQLSSQIMSLSGFDDEDVRDALSAKN